MKKILLSVQPEWVCEILNKKKFMEARKTIPKCDLPCEVSIYCTKGKPYLYRIDDDDEFELTNELRFEEDCFVKDYNAQNGKVVASFVLNEVDTIKRNLNDWLLENEYDVSDKQLQDMQLNQKQLWKYGKGKTLYGWRIDDLKIYDKPKELSEFSTILKRMKGKESRFTSHLLQRPPQSWRYVEVSGEKRNII